MVVRRGDPGQASSAAMPKALQAAVRAAGGHDEDRHPTAAGTAARPPAAPSWWAQGTSFGGAVALLAFIGLLLTFTVPFLTLSAPGTAASTELFHDDVKDAGFGAYMHHLVDWPVATYALLMVLGAGLVLLDFLPLSRARLPTALRVGLLLATGHAALFLALTGSRWLGFQIQMAMQPGRTLVHLGAVPYFNLAIGLLVLAGAVALLAAELERLGQRWGEGRLPPETFTVPVLTVATAAAALLLLPLLPFSAHDVPNGTSYASEHLFHVHHERDPGHASGQAGHALAWARGMLWVVYALSLAGAAAAFLERSGRRTAAWGALAQLPILNVVPIATGVVWTTLATVHILAIEGASLALNHLLPLTYFALVLLTLHHALQAFLPWSQATLRRPQPSPAGPDA